jgi:hypothetical protein
MEGISRWVAGLLIEEPVIEDPATKQPDARRSLVHLEKDYL